MPTNDDHHFSESSGNLTNIVEQTLYYRNISSQDVSSDHDETMKTGTSI